MHLSIKKEVIHFENSGGQFLHLNFNFAGTFNNLEEENIKESS